MTLTNDNHTGPQLHFLARQALVRCKCDAVARILDALYILVGWPPDQIFTATELIQICEVHAICKAWYVYRALGTTLTVKDQTMVFFPEVPGPNMPNVQRKRGRPEIYYRLPSPDDVCKLLGVSSLPRFPFEPEDLKSTRAYREAVHRAGIALFPGQHSREKLGKRLGVCGSTTRNYEKSPRLADVKVEARVREVKVVEHISDVPDNAPGHWWLQDTHGKKYQVTSEAAARLLDRSDGPLKVMSHAPNEYSVEGYGPDGRRVLRGG